MGRIAKEEREKLHVRLDKIEQVYMLFLMCIQRMIGNLDGKAMILKELLVLLLI